MNGAVGNASSSAKHAAPSAADAMCARCARRSDGVSCARRANSACHEVKCFRHLVQHRHGKSGEALTQCCREQRLINELGRHPLRSNHLTVSAWHVLGDNQPQATPTQCIDILDLQHLMRVASFCGCNALLLTLNLVLFL